MAFLRPGRRISRRIYELIALADGRTLVAPSGRMPYLMAGLVVAALGLQVGAQVATQDMNGFAIVLGDTTVSDSEYWTPAEMRHRVPQHEVAARRARHEHEAARTPRYPELTREFLVKEKNLPEWFEWMAKRAERISTASVAWEGRREWRATPVFRQPSGGVAIYRLSPPS
jgi:hypothetical protein